MTSPAPLTEVMLPARRVTASVCPLPSADPSVSTPSGARTMPPWSIVSPSSLSWPKADQGIATSPATARRMVSEVPGANAVLSER